MITKFSQVDQFTISETKFCFIFSDTNEVLTEKHDLIASVVGIFDTSCQKFVCQGCGVRFRGHGGLAFHLRNECGKIMKCPCNRSFKSRSGLRRHLRTKHIELDDMEFQKQYPLC